MSVLNVLLEDIFMVGSLNLRSAQHRKLFVRLLTVSAAEMSPPHTPLPRGPFVTGCGDVMVGPTTEGTLMRMFYPSSFKNIKDHEKEWSQWFLGEQYCAGMARFVSGGMPKLVSPSASYFLSRLISWKTSGMKIPAVWEAPVADGVFPVIVFSHGLAANRSIYSTVCNEIASFGFVVAAVEHRDESACCTFTLMESGEKEWHMYKSPSRGQKEFSLRNHQVNIRAEECSRALSVLEKINKDEVKNDLFSSFSLGQFKGKLDLGSATLSGHSFGSATTLLTLSKDKRFRVGVALDPWMFPIKDSTEALGSDVDQPLLIVLTEAFQTETNLNAMKPFERKDSVLTIKGSVHQNQTDSPHLAGYLGRLISGSLSTIDPKLATDINNSLMINFICKHLGVGEFRELFRCLEGNVIAGPVVRRALKYKKRKGGGMDKTGNTMTAAKLKSKL